MGLIPADVNQSFITSAPMGPGSSGDSDFSLCKAREYARHCRDIFMAISPAQILAITAGGLGMESKALQFHTTGPCSAQNMAL